MCFFTNFQAPSGTGSIRFMCNGHWNFITWIARHQLQILKCHSTHDSPIFAAFSPGAVHVLLSRFYPDFISILSRFYPDFILILSRYNQDKIWIKFAYTVKLGDKEQIGVIKEPFPVTNCQFTS